MSKGNTFDSSVLDVHSNFKYYFAVLFNRIANMFEFENIPDSVDTFYLKYLLYLTGKAIFFEKDGKLYVGNFNIGGEPNEYYMPKMAVFANPILGSENFSIGENAVAVYASSADRLAQYSLPLGSGATLHGVCPTYDLIRKTAELLADCVTSINIVQKNSRAAYLITAPTTAEKNGVEIAMKKVYSGDPFTCVVDGGQLDNIHILPMATQSIGNTALKELRETHQFYLSQFYHAIGVGSNSNFKRERMTDDEVQTENSPLLINIADMEDTLKRGIDEVNKRFGVDINVKFSDAWENIKESEVIESALRTSDTERDSPRDDG